MSKAKTHVYNNRIELTVAGHRFRLMDGADRNDWHMSGGPFGWRSAWDLAPFLNEIARYRSRSYHV